MKQKQSKKVQLGLLFAVVVVWGLVVFRFRQMSEPGDDASMTYTYSLPVREPDKKQFDTLALSLDYPDPFLGIQQGVRSLSTLPARKDAVRPVATLPPPGLSRPPVYYRGYSKDKDARNRARLVINGKSMTLAEGEHYQNFKLLSVFRDSVHAEWQGSLYSIKRQR